LIFFARRFRVEAIHFGQWIPQMSAKIRTLIVDDEPLARDRLRALLEKAEDIELVGECGDGSEALAAIEQSAPDLLFLDVQMPEIDGFGLLERIPADRMPAIVFVTAYDKFALRAFEVHALDYLLKPFDSERFEKALERVRETIQHRKDRDLGRRISDLLTDVRHNAERVSGRFPIKSGGRVIFLKTEEIDWIEAADNYVSLHVGNEAHLHRETMSALESRLPEETFLRISRSAIVNVERIKELQPLFHGEYAVILRNGTRLTLSRSYRDKLDQLLGKTD
jgi:two-component system LytT family response regulator